MWDTLAKYQPYADADGHGETWRVMCEERTEDAALAAAWVAEEAVAAAGWGTAGWVAAREAAGWVAAREAAARTAARAADAAAATEDVAYWSDRVIRRIEAAIKEREPVPSNIEPVSNDDGQAQTVDAPEPLIHKHEWFRTGAMAHGVCRCIHCGAWNHEIDAPRLAHEIYRLRQQGAALKTERDAAVRELELTTVERNRAYYACEQISVRLHAAEAERDALLEALEAMTNAFLDTEGKHGTVEFDAMKKAYAAIDAARGET
jgi:hypothetical protein